MRSGGCSLERGVKMIKIQVIHGPNLNLREVRRESETRAIQRALVYASGNISQAAKLLGITRPTLYDLIDKYAIDVER